MPRKSKITAVPIEPLTVDQGGEENVGAKTDAEQMTDVLKEVNVETQPEAPSEPVQIKAKPKRAATKKSSAKEVPFVDPEVTAESNFNEVVAEVTLPKEEVKVEAKTDAKVDCPDCGKKMSAKTLKYSHAPNCAAKKQKTTEVPVDTPRDDNAVRDVREEMIEYEVQRRMNGRRSERAARREEMVSKLIQNAFP